MSKSKVKTQTYKIGAVSRMTGIPTDTIRVWERRYSVVQPGRSPAGGRIYRQEDVNRLLTIKTLVDRGDSISSIAGLDLSSLKARQDSAEVMTKDTRFSQLDHPCRIVIISESTGLHIRNIEDDVDDLLVVARFSSTEHFESKIGSLKSDVLLIEISTLHKEDSNMVMKWLRLSDATHAFVVYRFGNAEAFHHIPTSRCTLIHAPTDLQTIRQHCLALFSRNLEKNKTSIGESTEIAAARKYDDETLARIAMLSTTIKCECPKHITELIISLAAFERYSNECESLSPKDAALHVYLNNTVALAREMMESALTRVIKAENIEI